MHQEWGHMPVRRGDQVWILEGSHAKGHGGNTRDLWAYASRDPYLVTDGHDAAVLGWISAAVIGAATHLLDDGADEESQPEADAAQEPLDAETQWWHER